jgi:hypothetical protein
MSLVAPTPPDRSPLRDSDPEVRAYYLGKLMRHAKPDDAFTFVTLAEITALYSESNFRTLKYRPDMPEQLGSLEHARQVTRALVDWYNDDHYHVGLALLHPVDVHHGRAVEIVAARQRVLEKALARHPERFVRGRPVQKTPPAAAWINPPPMDQIAITSADRIEEVAAR